MWILLIQCSVLAKYASKLCSVCVKVNHADVTFSCNYNLPLVNEVVLYSLETYEHMFMYVVVCVCVCVCVWGGGEWSRW